MAFKNFVRENPLAALGGCLLLGMVLSSSIIGNAVIEAKKFGNQDLMVTGSAQMPIVSDSATWTCRFSRQSAAMKDAYQELRNDLATVKKYLTSKGLSDKDLSVSAVSTSTLYGRDNNANTIEGYRLSQSIRVESVNVDLITQLSQQSTELIEQGIGFESDAPEYYYNKLNDLKIDMLGKAMENAKRRAEQMAKSTGNRIGVMRSASMGVFQITPKNSTEVSDYGINDTSSKDKNVTAVVNVTFSVQ